MAEEEKQNLQESKTNWGLIALVIFLVAVPGCGIGCVGIGTVGYLALTSTESGLSPLPATNEERYWSALADFIQDHPERFEDTDRVYRIGQELQELGKVSSVDRLSAYKAQMQAITDANRSQVVSSVRGK